MERDVALERALAARHGPVIVLGHDGRDRDGHDDLALALGHDGHDGHGDLAPVLMHPAHGDHDNLAPLVLMHGGHGGRDDLASVHGWNHRCQENLLVPRNHRCQENLLIL